VYRLPYREWDVVRARGRGIRGLGEGPGYVFGCEGSIVLVASEAAERARRGLWGKKVVKVRFRHLGRVGGP